MNYISAFLMITFIAVTYTDELSECTCWQGYEPKETENGVRCYGILVLHTRSCNEPERPKCDCNGNVTGILTDSDGTWCSLYSKGEQQKKWPCENKKEWDKFYEQYPKEKP